jgi:hypothetical protein
VDYVLVCGVIAQSCQTQAVWDNLGNFFKKNYLKFNISYEKIKKNIHVDIT